MKVGVGCDETRLRIEAVNRNRAVKPASKFGLGTAWNNGM
jgi:hypothetical protein